MSIICTCPNKANNLFCTSAEGCKFHGQTGFVGDTPPPPKATKYYFISSMWAHEPGPQFGAYRPQSCVIEGQHPFEYISYLNKLPVNNGYTTVLLSWQEITKEEYELYNKLEL
jgi:hypothetical protein